MKKKIVKAFSWDFAGSVIGFGSTFLTSLVLARLLTPAEFGIVAIAMAFIFIFNIISESGLRQALIQSQDVDQLTYSSVFFFNVGFGTFLTAIVYAGAPLIADFYQEVVLTPVLRLLSLTFIFNSFSLVQIAIFSKKLAFKSLSIRIVIAKVSAAVLGIILAFKGYGVYALVWQEILFSILNAILLWYLSDWRPSWMFAWAPLKKLYNFGVYIFGSQVLNEIIQRLDELFIGKIFSTSTLGFFDRSNSISQMINGLTSKSINSVFFPVMSNMQDNDKAFKATYFNMLIIISIVSFAITGIAFLSSDAIILGLFGNQWTESIPIFEILMFKLFTYPASRFLFVALLAKGYAKQHFYHGLVRKGLRLSIFLVAFFYGFVPFLYASVIVSFINVLYNNFINSHYMDIPIWNQVKPLVYSSLTCIFALILANYVKFDQLGLYLSALVRSLIFIIIFLSVIGLVYKNQVLTLYQTAKRIIGKKIG